MSYTREQIECVCSVLNIHATANAAKKESNPEGDALAIIRQLLAENDALREDAERYRWLKNVDTDTLESIGFNEYCGNDLDSAIDAARKRG